MGAIRVLLVDDHAVVREGTRQVLEHEPDLTVVGEAGSGAEALRLAEELRPDIVLLDLALPDASGIDVARQIRDSQPDAKIVVLSAYDDDDYVLAALEVGAAAYLLKTVRAQEVVEAIHASHHGQIILHPSVAAKVRQSLRRGSQPEPEALLSAREIEILRQAARGLHNKEIADALFISVRTVETHLSHILTKLGVSSRTEAVTYAVSHRWLSVDDQRPNARPGPARREL
ncbi:MAG TPA: response regulator transcription factor [Thermomicrobiaceae bacterium]|nr:response regulator transcription factor [Thermomicrobiaceae bacterium]